MKTKERPNRPIPTLKVGPGLFAQTGPRAVLFGWRAPLVLFFGLFNNNVKTKATPFLFSILFFFSFSFWFFAFLAKEKNQKTFSFWRKTLLL